MQCATTNDINILCNINLKNNKFSLSLVISAVTGIINFNRYLLLVTIKKLNYLQLSVSYFKIFVNFKQIYLKNIELIT